MNEARQVNVPTPGGEGTKWKPVLGCPWCAVESNQASTPSSALILAINSSRTRWASQSAIWHVPVSRFAGAVNTTLKRLPLPSPD
jgi:hypothetical protein